MSQTATLRRPPRSTTTPRLRFACEATGPASCIACATTRSLCSLALIVLLIVLSAIFAPLLAPFDPYKESVILRLKPWGYRGHLLGTDELGRDLLSRLIYGGRSSLLMGLVPVADRHGTRGNARRHRRFRRSLRERRDHAHDGRVLRVPVRSAGGSNFRRDGRRHGERHGGARTGVHPRDVPRRRNRDRTGTQPGLHRGRTRNRCRHAHHHPLPRARQRAGPRLHLCLEPGLASASCSLRACRSSAWA